MTRTIEATVPEAGLSTLAQELLPLLYQHRLVATSQLRELLQPHARESRYLRRELEVLRSRGLAGATVRRRAGQGELLHYATPLGCEVVEASGEVRPRAYRMTEQAAAGQLQEHTLAVNDTGVAFVRAARHSGHDECGPRDWEAELAHRMRDGEDRLADRAFLVPDGVLRYTHVEGRQRQLLTFFLEVDRATEHVSVLAGKLAAYARYRAYVPAAPSSTRGRARAGTRPAWRDRYPHAFPYLLIVLAGKGEAALARRTADLRALAAADPQLARASEGLQAGVTTLTQLQQKGPFACVVTPVFGSGEQTDVLLRQPDDQTVSA